MRERLDAGGELCTGIMQELFPDSIWLEEDKNGLFCGRTQWAFSPVVTSPGPVGRLEEFPMIYQARMGPT